MADIRIYNANQIGGNYTVITSNGTRIMIDYGTSLPGSNEKQEEFDWEKDHVDAVFFTHYHADHVGRMLEIPRDIPLYMGLTARKVLLNIHRYLSRIEELHDQQMEYVELLEDDSRIHEFKEGRSCGKIGDIEVIPYSVDHSAYDAYMFLIKTPDETILHTGDFREHGYRGSHMIDLIKKYVLPRAKDHIDTLIIEGTMMERLDEKVRTERDLQQEAKKLFQKHKYVFLVCSSTNLDTLASFYHAALKNHMYTYCYSRYLLTQLKTFTETAGEYTSLYRFDKAFLVELDRELTKPYWEKPKTQKELMREKGFLCIIKPGERYAEWIEKFRDLNPLVVYALWDGYLDPARDAYNKDWDDFFQPYKASGQFLELHTSGHATADTIAKVIETVKPQKRIFPMHTGKAEEFKNLKISEEYKRRIVVEMENANQGKFNERQLPEKFERLFLEGGPLRPLLEMAVRDDSYCFELRGNSVVIYYRGGALFTINYNKKGWKIVFNKKYYKKDVVNNETVDLFVNEIGKEITCEQAVENIYLFKHIMDCYFISHPKLERQVQQEFVKTNNRVRTIANSTDYYILDIEYAFNGNTQDAVFSSNQKVRARFDALALEWPSLREKRKDKERLGLTFIELKYGDGAISGTAGIQKHIEDFLKFSSDKQMIEHLCSDMETVYAQKKELGLIRGDKGRTEKIKIDRSKIKMIFGFVEHDPDSKEVVTEIKECIQKYEEESSQLAGFLDNIYVAKASEMGYGLYSLSNFGKKNRYPTIREYVRGCD